jgi:hypothetical protein
MNEFFQICSNHTELYRPIDAFQRHIRAQTLGLDEWEDVFSTWRMYNPNVTSLKIRVFYSKLETEIILTRKRWNIINQMEFGDSEEASKAVLASKRKASERGNSRPSVSGAGEPMAVNIQDEQRGEDRGVDAANSPPMDFDHLVGKSSMKSFHFLSAPISSLAPSTLPPSFVSSPANSNSFFPNDYQTQNQVSAPSSVQRADPDRVPSRSFQSSMNSVIHSQEGQSNFDVKQPNAHKRKMKKKNLS